MNITATHINYYHICHRKLWLFSNRINMEHTSEIVADRKLLHEVSYPQRAEKCLTESDRNYLKLIVANLTELKQSETCPPRINSKSCKSCSYYELCYVKEV